MFNHFIKVVDSYTVRSAIQMGAYHLKDHKTPGPGYGQFRTELAKRYRKIAAKFLALAMQIENTSDTDTKQHLHGTGYDATKRIKTQK